MATYPTFESLLRAPDSKNLLRVKRGLRSIFSMCAWVFITFVLVAVTNIAFDGVAQLSRFSPGLPDISLRWLALIPALLLLNVLREYHDDVYVFGLHGITQYQGRLSLSKRVPHVKYADILSLRVRQDPWGRILNYGDIDLDTAADAGVEMIIEGVPNPDELSKLVERLRLYSLRTGMAEPHQSERLIPKE